MVEEKGTDETAPLGEAHDHVVGPVGFHVVQHELVCAADGVDGWFGPPCVGTGFEEDFDSWGRSAVEGGVDEVEGVGFGEFVAEGDWKVLD